MVCKYRHLHRRTAVLPPEIIIIIPPRRIHRHTHCLIRFSCFGSFSITPPQCAHSRTPLKATEQLRWNVMWCFCFSTDEFFFSCFSFSAFFSFYVVSLAALYSLVYRTCFRRLATFQMTLLWCVLLSSTIYGVSYSFFWLNFHLWFLFVSLWNSITVTVIIIIWIVGDWNTQCALRSEYSAQCKWYIIDSNRYQYPWAIICNVLVTCVMSNFDRCCHLHHFLYP